MNTRNYQLAIIGASSLLLVACGTNPVEQSKSNAQEEYKQQAKVATQAISEAPAWMTKLPKETGIIYENGTAVSSDFAMADLKAKTMAYVKICTGAGAGLAAVMTTVLPVGVKGALTAIYYSYKILIEPASNVSVPPPVVIRTRFIVLVLVIEPANVYI